MKEEIAKFEEALKNCVKILGKELGANKINVHICYDPYSIECETTVGFHSTELEGPTCATAGVAKAQ